MSLVEYKAYDVVERLHQLFINGNINLESYKDQSGLNAVDEIEASLDMLDKFGQVQKYPNMDRASFDQILQYVKTANGIVCLSPNQKAETVTDYFYPNSIRRRVKMKSTTDNESKSEIKTESSKVDPNKGEANKNESNKTELNKADLNKAELHQTVEEWIQKKSKCTSNIRCPEKNIGIRFRVKSETTLKPLPKHTPVLSIRSKQTLLFYNKENAMFIAFSCVWKGENEQQCLESTPTFEIEVEADLTGLCNKQSANNTLVNNSSTNNNSSNNTLVNTELYNLAGKILYQTLDLFAGFAPGTPCSLQWIN